MANEEEDVKDLIWRLLFPEGWLSGGELLTMAAVSTSLRDFILYRGSHDSWPNFIYFELPYTQPLSLLPMLSKPNNSNNDDDYLGHLSDQRDIQVELSEEGKQRRSHSHSHSQGRPRPRHSFALSTVIHDESEMKQLIAVSKDLDLIALSLRGSISLSESDKLNLLPSWSSLQITLITLIT